MFATITRWAVTGRGYRTGCVWGVIIRLVTGCSWQSAEFLLDGEVSETTLRSRRDEWVAAGVFDRVAGEAVAAWDRIMGLRLGDVCIDGSTHKAPSGGAGTGKSAVDRRKLGWKWSLAADRAGIPVAWGAAGANRNDIMLFELTLDRVAHRGLHHDIDTVHLDRGYIGTRVVHAAASMGITDIVRPPKRPPKPGGAKPTPAPLGLRWSVERTNSWLSNYDATPTADPSTASPSSPSPSP